MISLQVCLQTLSMYQYITENKKYCGTNQSTMYDTLAKFACAIKSEVMKKMYSKTVCVGGVYMLMF